jgi:GH35 family endo-1,4-beta-xylanase
MTKNIRSSVVVFVCTLLALVFFAPTANAQPPKTLTVNVQGAGTVTLNPPGGAYPRGTTVVMTATPAPGWTFNHWEGPTIGGSTANPQPITMYNNYTVTAFFETPKGVDLIRKRAVVVRVEDGGVPVSGVSVSVNLRKRAFPFGTAVTNQMLANAKYRNFVRQNSPLFWDWSVFGNEAKWYANEAAQGFVNYQDADAMADLLTGWGFSLRGHAIFWDVQANVQQWVQNLPYPGPLQAAVDARLNSVVPHFQGIFKHWDVNNEMLHGNFFEDRLGPGITKYMHDRTSELDPAALVTINDYNVIAGGWDTNAYKALILDLEAQGIRIDILGVQCHMNTDDTVAEINQRLDSVAELGYPIWVTEFDIVATDPLVRAQYVEDFYRTVYGHPAVEGIIMWGFWAGEHWRGPNAALVNTDWTLNAAGQRYADLMNEWWTEAAGVSNAFGEFSLSAFHGDYEVTLTPSGGSPEAHAVTVAAGSGTEIVTLELGNGTPSDVAAPSPDPIAWDVPPAAVDDTAISMLATLASDPSGVEYYFANLTNPSHDSGWLDTPFYTDTGVTAGITYTYRVTTRDRSVNQNPGLWSTTASAATSTDNELIVNGGFEYGYPDGWAGFAGASILVTDVESASGGFSCFVGNRSETYKGIEQNLLGKMIAGHTYDISAWFLLSNSASQPTKLTIKQTDASGTNYHTFATGSATNTAWSETGGTFTLNVTGTLSFLSLFTEGPAVGVELFVDDVSMIEVGAPFCGDLSCNGTETKCTCAGDCGAPPATETICNNGVDDDCDGPTDCADSNCSAAPNCVPACDNDTICESGETCTNCIGDCPGVQSGKPANRYCCGNGVAESAEGNGSICDGNY